MVSLGYFHLQDGIKKHIEPALAAGDVDSCIEATVAMLKRVPISKFHIVRDLDFTTCPEDTASKFDEWVGIQIKKCNFGSSYTETNGFAHNTDQWHFHWFAYRRKPARGNYDYIGDGWVSEDHEEVILTGMEPLQRVFAEPYRVEDDVAKDICEIVVICKFMKLIQMTCQRMKMLKHPLVASSHDSSLFVQFKPPSKRKAATIPRKS